MTVETYHALVERGLVGREVELLRGVILRKMSKSPLHSTVTQALLERLRSRLGPGLLVRQEQPITLADSEPEPDIAVVRGDLLDFSRRHPSTAVLVIEVAVSTEERDDAKADIYAEGGVDEYWIVRPDERLVVVHRRPTPHGYLDRVTVSEGGLLDCPALPGLEVPVERLFPPDAGEESRRP